MVKKLIALFAVTCVLNLALATIVPAQPATDDHHVRQVKIFVNNVGLGNKQKVKVKRAGQSGTLKGHITRISDDDFVVTDPKGAETTIAYSDVRDISRDHVSYWIIGALAAGALLAIVGICTAAGRCQE